MRQITHTTLYTELPNGSWMVERYISHEGVLAAAPVTTVGPKEVQALLAPLVNAAASAEQALLDEAKQKNQPAVEADKTKSLAEVTTLQTKIAALDAAIATEAEALSDEP